MVPAPMILPVGYSCREPFHVGQGAWRRRMPISDERRQGTDHLAHSPGQGGDHRGHPGTDASTATKAIDPVCGMTVDPHASLHCHSYRVRTYYFCSVECREKFAADPAKYVGSETPKPALAPIPE